MSFVDVGVLVRRCDDVTDCEADVACDVTVVVLLDLLAAFDDVATGFTLACRD